jgi:hypothetical protein
MIAPVADKFCVIVDANGAVLSLEAGVIDDVPTALFAIVKGHYSSAFYWQR